MNRISKFYGVLICGFRKLLEMHVHQLKKNLDVNVNIVVDLICFIKR